MQDLDWWASQVAVDDSEPVPGILSFPEWVRMQAAAVRGLGSDAGNWLAEKIAELAAEVEFTDAKTPAEHEDRIEVMAAGSSAAYSIGQVRLVARMLDFPFECLAPELTRAADSLEQIVNARK